MPAGFCTRERGHSHTNTYMHAQTHTHTHTHTLVFHGLSSRIWFIGALKVYLNSALNTFQGSKDLELEYCYSPLTLFKREENSFWCNKNSVCFKVTWSSLAYLVFISSLLLNRTINTLFFFFWRIYDNNFFFFI